MASSKKQRTKGNTRPSSSGRAADLLARDGSSGAGVSGFIGFGTMSGDLGYVPAAQSLSMESDQDASLEADFRMALRKLTKRDVVTKLKAIQEFGALCKEKDTESVKATLPHWPRIYSRLATDHDKRVREATQQAFEQLILRVRRNLAPQLRALMGTWLIAQNDTYAPAALSARAAFSSAFPVAKQGEAVAFCKTVVLKFLEDNLLKESPASLSDPRSYTPDEQEEKYLRILTSSLLGLGEFVEVLPEKELPTVLGDLGSILGETKLWKLAKNKSPQLRGAMYSMQGCLIRSAPSVAQAELARISSTLLGSLDESDPLAVQSLWQSVLLLVSTHPTCWEHLAVRKAVLPKLWSMLKNGGSGNATVIHPNLLPLLSHVPQDVLGTGVGFYREFFDSIKQGLTCSSAQQSTSEYGAIINAYMECIRYAISQCVTSETVDDSQIVQSYLIEDQLIPLLSQSITEDGSHLMATSLYLQSAKLLSHLRKHLEKTSSAIVVLNMFWTSLRCLCKEWICPAESDRAPGSSLVRISVLLSQLQFPDKSLRSKRMSRRSVSFSDAESPEAADAEPQLPPVVSAEHPELLHLVHELVRSSFEMARSINSLPHLKFLVRILDSFKKAELFEELLGTDGEDPGAGEREAGDEGEVEEGSARQEDDVEAKEDNEERDASSLASQPPSNISHTKDYSTILRRCFEEVLLPWVLSEEAKRWEGDSALKPEVEALSFVVNIVEAAYRCADDELKKVMLDEVCQRTNNPDTLYLLIKQILRGPRSSCLRAWLKSAKFGEKLLKLTEALCFKALDGDADKPQSHSWNLINLGLSVEKDEEPSVDASYAEQILAKFADTLMLSKVEVGGNNLRAHSCIGFICDMAANFFSAVRGCLLISSAEGLLLALFQLSCKEARSFPESLQQKIQSAWTKGAESLLRQTGGYMKEDGFLCRAASWIRSCLDQGPHSISSLELLSRPAVALIDVILSSLPDQSEPDVAESFLALLVPTEDEWSRCMDLPNQWMESLLLKETLTFTDLPEVTPANPSSTMLTGLVQAVFTAILIRPSDAPRSPEAEDNLFAESKKPGDRDAKETDGWVAVTQLPWRYDVLAPILKRLLYSLQWCKGTMGVDTDAVQVQAHNASVAMPAYCLEATSVINATLEAVWKVLAVDDWQKLMCNVLEESMASGYLWASSLSYLLSCYERYPGKETKLDVLQLAHGSDRFAVLNLPLIHTLEAVAPHLTQEQRLDLLEINTAKLLTSKEGMVVHSDGGLGSMSVVTAIVRSQDSKDITNQSDIVASCIQQLMQWRQDYQELFLFGSDFRDAVIFDDVFLNIKMMQLMRLALEKQPMALSEETWDFVLCSVTSWIQTCSQNIEYALSSALITAFCCAAFDLLSCASTLLGGSSGTSSLPANLCAEWKEFYSDKAFSLMLPLFVTIVESTDFGSLVVSRHHLLQSASDAVSRIPPEQLMNHTLSRVSSSSTSNKGAAKTSSSTGPARGESSSKTAGTSLQILLDRLSPMLLKTDRSAKLAAFQLLEKVMDGVAKTDEERSKDESSEDKDKREEESSIPPPETLKEILDSASAYMDVILADVQVGECLTLDPTNDGYHQSLSNVLTYLLVWRLYLRIFKAASAEVRAGYANYLRQTNGVSSLMMNIFRLMPDPPVTGNGNSPSPGKGSSTQRSMFSAAPIMKAKGVSPNHQEIHHQSCALYYSILEDLPAMVRQWWTSQDKKLSAIVDRFTTKYASPLLCSQEVQGVQTATQTYENMTVKARSTTREVIATYTMQDLTMDLTVRIPANHPLGIITVDSEKKVGVGTTQWRNWTLQLTTFLRNQNGSIMDGLTLWKRNVDKRFEGVEDCMICFSVIHGSNCSLPKLQCKTCKKRYHSACLYKWFSTSNQSTCPLCRSPF